MSAGVWAAWAGVAVALIAVIASGIFNRRTLKFNRMTLKAAREQTELQRQIAREAAQPMIWADVRPDKLSETVIELIVGNSGPTVARNVHVSIDPPLPESQDNEFTGVAQRQLQNGIAALPPGREMRWFLFYSVKWSIIVPTGASIHHFIITADGPYGPLPPIAYDLNLTDMMWSKPDPPGSLHDVAEELKKISDKLPAENKPIRVAVEK